MLRNFTATDVVGTVEASLLLTLILFIPGYAVGWLSDAFAFRQRRFALQLVLSTPLAVATIPIVVYLLGPYTKILWTLFAAAWLAFFFLSLRILQRWWRLRFIRAPRAVWIGAAFALAWAVVVIFSLADVQLDGRLYFSSAAYDNSTRAAFTAAAARSIPAHNPFFGGSPAVLLRYHYFWMMISSLVTRLAHVNPRYALYGGTVWAGIALMSSIVMAVKFFLGAHERVERKAVIACSLLLVTGLDIVPTAYRFLRWHMVTPDMEWWNEQITSWVDGLVWAPHHIMGLVACMVGLLALRQPASNKYHRAAAILIAGLAFASSTGLSVLVTFTFALFAAFWLLLAASRKWWDDVAGLAAAGAIAVAAAFPYLRTLTGSGGSGSGVNSAFFVQVRSFYFAIDRVASIIHTPVNRVPAPELILLLLLPLNYFLELGFYFLVGVLRLVSIRAGIAKLSRDEEIGWMIVGTSFLVGSFLRSTTIASNDLGWRCFLQAQFVLLLWGASWIDDWWAGLRDESAKGRLVTGFAAVLLALGAIGTVYQVAMLRAYPILADAGKVDANLYRWLDQDHRLGERTFALRSVYDSLEAMLPGDAIVQYNPDEPAFIPHQLYSRHGAAIGLPLCGTTFGGDVSRCAGQTRFVAPLFNTPSPSESADLDRVCREYNIEIMLVDDRDPVWNDRQSWVWARKPLIANEHVRAFACGDSGQQLRLASAR